MLNAFPRRNEMRKRRLRERERERDIAEDEDEGGCPSFLHFIRTESDSLLNY